MGQRPFLKREAFGVRAACCRSRRSSNTPKRQQAARTPNASRPRTPGSRHNTSPDLRPGVPSWRRREGEQQMDACETRHRLRGWCWLGAQLAACLLVLTLGLVQIHAAEVIPPRPPRYFNDYAGVASADTASRLNKTLEDFERDTSSQILVAVYPKMQSDSSIEDYTVRVAQAVEGGAEGEEQRRGAVRLHPGPQDVLAGWLRTGGGIAGRAWPSRSSRTNSSRASAMATSTAA